MGHALLGDGDTDTGFKEQRRRNGGPRNMLHIQSFVVNFFLLVVKCPIWVLDGGLSSSASCFPLPRGR